MSRGGISQFPTQYLANDAPIGQISPWPSTTAPVGYLLCYGQAVSRTLYSQLFSVIGTAFGVGDGSTTFNVPDMRGRTWFGVDNLGGTDAGRLDLANTVGTTGGVQKHTLLQSEMPSHTHTQNAHSHSATSANQSANHTHAGSVLSGAMSGSHMTVMADVQAATPGPSPVTSGITANHSHAITVNSQVATNQNTGGGGAHENMPPFVLGGWIIKAKYLSANVVIGLTPDDVTLEATEGGLLRVKGNPPGIAWGLIDRVAVTANRTSSGSTATDATDLSITFEAVAGRRYRARFSGGTFASGNGATSGSIIHADGSNAALRQTLHVCSTAVNHVESTYEWDESTGGSVTRKVRVARALGASDNFGVYYGSAAQAATYSIEDIGPVPS